MSWRNFETGEIIRRPLTEEEKRERQYEYKKRYLAKHPEAVEKNRERMRIWARSHREEMRAYKEAWNIVNREKVREYGRKFYKKHRERLIAEQRERYRKKKEAAKNEP